LFYKKIVFVLIDETDGHFRRHFVLVKFTSDVYTLKRKYSTYFHLLLRFDFSGSSLRRNLHQLDVPDHHVRRPLCPPPLAQLEDRTGNPFGQNPKKKDDKVKIRTIFDIHCTCKLPINQEVHTWSFMGLNFWGKLNLKNAKCGHLQIKWSVKDPFRARTVCPFPIKICASKLASREKFHQSFQL
jgi:hypothetical protein